MSNDEIKLWRVSTTNLEDSPIVSDWAVGEGRTLEDAVRFVIEDAGLEDEVMEHTGDGDAPLIFGGYVIETWDHSGELDIKAMGDERVLVWSNDGSDLYTCLVPREPKFKLGQWVRHIETGAVFKVETFGWGPDTGYIYRGVTSPHEGKGTWWEYAHEDKVELTDDPTPPQKKPPVEVCRVEEDGSSAILLEYEGGGYTLDYEPIMFSRGARDDIGELIEEERRRLRERIELLGKLAIRAGAEAPGDVLLSLSIAYSREARRCSKGEDRVSEADAIMADLKRALLADDPRWSALNHLASIVDAERAKQLLGVRKLELEPKIEGKGQITLGENTWRTLIKLDEQGRIELLDGELRYWRIDDGERHWVKAATRTDAVLVYVRACEPDWVHDRSCDPPEVVELDPSDPIEAGEDDGPEMKVRKGPIGEVFADDPTGLLCSTVW